jgi:hypothetical protein
MTRSNSRTLTLGSKHTHPTVHSPGLRATPPSFRTCSAAPRPELNLSSQAVWARPLCGRMDSRAGAQSKLNLHLGAPSGRSAQRSHRSLLIASSKCEAAASAPRVRALPPSLPPSPPPCARCKMVFTKVNIGGADARAPWSPLASSSPGLDLGRQGLVLGFQLALVLKRSLMARHRQASTKAVSDQ